MQRLYTILYENIRGMLILDWLEIVISNRSKYQAQHRATRVSDPIIMQIGRRADDRKTGETPVFLPDCAQPLELPFPVAVLRN